ncbi:MAG: hypothetical protein EOO77_15555, partial [Oxalobacteraceae bacterium]
MRWAPVQRFIPFERTTDRNLYKYARAGRFRRAFGTDGRRLEPRQAQAVLNRHRKSRKGFTMNDFPTRRTIISGASLAGASLAGAALANMSNEQTVPAGVRNTADNGVATPISIRQFGAIGDGGFHPLSTRFPSLSAARNEYPVASALSDSLDGAAIQAAINYAEQLGRSLQARCCVHIPAGRYRLSRSIRLPSNVVLIGDGIGVSIIDNQNTPLDVPLIVNADPDVVAMSIEDLSLHGGTHGIRITAKQYVDGFDLHRVSFQMQSDKNLECNRLLQIGTLVQCVFAKAPYGVYVAEWTTNVVSFHDCRFEDHSRTALRLNGAECVNFFGGRFESGRGIHGNDPTLSLDGAAAVNFHGVYFEGTPPVLLRESRSRHGVTFTGCHFTGSANPGGPPGAYRFESDGIVNFGPNDWGTPSPGPARMAIFGPNAGLVGTGRRYLLRTPTDWRIHSEQVGLAPGGSHDLVTITRVGSGKAAASI